MAEATAATIARFRGTVHCRREAAPLGLTLSGRSADQPEEQLALGFAGTAPADLPASLEDAVIERSAAGRYRIASAAGEWWLDAGSVHLHREVADAFYRAIPPRPAPPTRRLLYRVMLGLAGTRLGLTVMRALRR
jgi:hypothetical protein